MIKVKPSATILDKLDGEEIIRKIERCIRVCYQSQISGIETAKRLIKGVIESGHESVIEHVSVTVRFICDRATSHEIVRHRIASYTQESTRYVKYLEEFKVIAPTFDEPGAYDRWEETMRHTEEMYKAIYAENESLDRARAVLPNCLRTELIMTANLREWRHFFKLRTHKAAHESIRYLSTSLLKEFKELIPVIFDDIGA